MAGPGPQSTKPWATPECWGNQGAHGNMAPAPDAGQGIASTWSAHPRLLGGVAVAACPLSWRGLGSGSSLPPIPCNSRPLGSCSFPSPGCGLGLLALLGAQEGHNLALAGPEVPAPTAWPLPTPSTLSGLGEGLGLSLGTVSLAGCACAQGSADTTAPCCLGSFRTLSTDKPEGRETEGVTECGRELACSCSLV